MSCTLYVTTPHHTTVIHHLFYRCNVTSKPYNLSLQRPWQCVSTQYKKPSHEPQVLPERSYMMITRCPSTTNNRTATDCLRPDTNTTNATEVLPVTTEDGKIYRNYRCAECHGVQNFTFWGFNIYCPGKNIHNDTDLNYTSEFLNKECFWLFAPPKTTKPSICTYAELCDHLIETPQSMKYTDLTNKCEYYMQLIHVNGMAYKNFHCAICNGFGYAEIHVPPKKQLPMPSLAMFFDYRATLSDDGDNPGSSTNSGINGTNGTARVNGTSRDNPHDVIGRYLTTIGLSLSVICLVLVIVTYLWFPKLRTVPGLVLLSLSLSLLAYQALLLATPSVTSYYQACKAIAVMLHFSILSAFAWMTIMSYDVTKTFAMQGKRRNARAGKVY